MKEKILKLRKEGKTYDEIKEILKCSKGTISYHCGENQKEKSKIRLRKLRVNNTLLSKIDKFKGKNKSRIRDFQRRENGHLLTKSELNFNANDVLKKIGNNPKCYLTGKNIDLLDSKTFSFDHIIPASRGGSNKLENLGLVDYTINQMKHNLTVEEFINKSIEFLKYQGYLITKMES